MAPKGFFLTMKVERLSAPAANILKQEMLAKGGDVAVSARATMLAGGTSDALVLGTLRQLRRVIATLREQPLGLSELAQQMEDAIEAYKGERRAPTRIGGHEFVWGERTYLMGVVNATDDSFSGNGLGQNVEGAFRQAKRMVEEGADIIDVGGESTRPGARAVPIDEELERVLPVIERLSGTLQVPVSVDTSKAPVARCCLEAGAHLINDVRGLAGDPDMARVVAEFGVPVVIAHHRVCLSGGGAVDTEGVGGHYESVDYEDLMADVIRDLRVSVETALTRGVAVERIIVDPGIGFGKTKEQNFELLAELAQLKVLGRPILVGTSRKSFIGLELGTPPDQRLEGTAASVALAVAHGADILRVHDVKEMKRVCRVTDATVRRVLDHD